MYLTVVPRKRGEGGEGGVFSNLYYVHILMIDSPPLQASGSSTAVCLSMQCIVLWLAHNNSYRTAEKNREYKNLIFENDGRTNFCAFFDIIYRRRTLNSNAGRYFRN